MDIRRRYCEGYYRGHKLSSSSQEQDRVFAQPIFGQMKYVSIDQISSEFRDQILSVRRLVDAGEDTIMGDSLGISRETRGLAKVIMFAAYERLMFALSREILECAASFRGKKRSLRPGLRAISISGSIDSVRASSHSNLWKRCAPRLIDDLDSTAASLNTS